MYKKAFGFQFMDEEKKIPANSQTRYHIWSITKTFTATMILQLIEDGALSLDTPLSSFFSGIPYAEKINIRMMLSHRSGIRDFTEDPRPTVGQRRSQNKSRLA